MCSAVVAAEFGAPDYVSGLSAHLCNIFPQQFTEIR